MARRMKFPAPRSAKSREAGIYLHAELERQAARTTAAPVLACGPALSLPPGAST